MLLHLSGGPPIAVLHSLTTSRAAQMGFIRNAVSLLAFVVIFSHVATNSQATLEVVGGTKASAYHGSVPGPKPALASRNVRTQGQEEVSSPISTVTSIPEAPSIMLMGTALLSLSMYSRRRSQRLAVRTARSQRV